MGFIVRVNRHRRNAGIGDLELAELPHAEAHLVGGTHRRPVRRHHIARRARIRQPTDTGEMVALRGVERQVHVGGPLAVAREPVVGALDEVPLIGRQGCLTAGPRRPPSRHPLYDGGVADEIAVVGHVDRAGVAGAGRRVEPHPQRGALLGPVERQWTPPLVAHRIDLQRRQEVEAHPPHAVAPRGEPDRGVGGEPEALGEGRVDPVGVRSQRVARVRPRRDAVVQVLRAPKLRDDLHLASLAAATQQ